MAVQPEAVRIPLHEKLRPEPGPQQVGGYHREQVARVPRHPGELRIMAQNPLHFVQGLMQLVEPVAPLLQLPLDPVPLLDRQEPGHHPEQGL